MVDVDALVWPCGCVKGMTPHGAGWSDCAFSDEQKMTWLLAVLKEQAGQIEQLQREATETVARSAGESLRQTSYDAPWFVGREPRRGNAVAIKSSCYTVLVVGDYYDGGSDEQEAALAAICEAVNASLAAATGELGSPPDCECDSLRAALVARDAELAEWKATANAMAQKAEDNWCKWFDLTATANGRLHRAEAADARAEALEAERDELQREAESESRAATRYSARLVAAERLAHARGEALEQIVYQLGHVEDAEFALAIAREALAGVVPPEQAPEQAPEEPTQ